MARCRLCQPNEDIPDPEVMDHLRLFHPGWDEGGTRVTDVTEPFEHPVITAAMLEPHGALCTDCRQEFKVGDHYTKRLLAMIGDTPVVEIVCVACGGSGGG